MSDEKQFPIQTGLLNDQSESGSVRDHQTRDHMEKTIVSPDGALSFLFGIFGLLLWYTSIFNDSIQILLTSAGLWLILSCGALCAALINMARGKQRGNINLLATLLLGFFPGINTLISLAASLYGYSYSPRLIGFVYITGGIYCLGMAYLRIDRPVYRFVSTLFVSFGLIFIGTGSIFKLPLLYHIGGWCMFGFALLSFYYGLSIMYLLFDSRLKQGPVLKKTAKASQYDYELGEEKDSVPVRAGFGTFSKPDPILSFIMAVFGILNCVSGFTVLPVEEELAVALIRLLLGIIYFFCALVLIFQGSPSGNLTLIFAVCFALFSSGRKMAGIFSEWLPASLDASLYGILQLFAGCYIACILPAMKNIPLYRFASTTLSALGLILFGLSEVCKLNILSNAAGCCFGLFAVLSVYYGLSSLIPALPQGKIWRPGKSERNIQTEN